MLEEEREAIPVFQQVGRIKGRNWQACRDSNPRPSD